MRYLYSLILYLMLPWVLLRQWLKGFRVPGYRRHWQQRFGFGDVNTVKDVIWIHAVSVGEVRAAQALIQSLLSDETGRPILITTMTPTGRDIAQRLFGQTVSYCYLPYDLPGSVRRFLTAVRPAIAVIMETEIWPNLYHQLHQRHIPLLLLNARLSQASLRGYLKLPALSRAAIHCVERIAAQSEEDARRFVCLGASRQQLSVVGNLKFDGQLPADFDERVTVLKNSLGSGRLIWLAGSTHAGEERQVLNAHRRILQMHTHALLIIVPRHPERAKEVGLLCQQTGMVFQYFSSMSAPLEATRVVIVDTLGDLVTLYGLAKAAFVGGSLTDKGGHNPVEALLAGAPVITGPSVCNFQAVYRELVDAGAVQMIETEAALADRVCGWFVDGLRRDAAAEAGLRVIGINRGALQRTMLLLRSELGAVDPG
ncbi:MAG: lipid IV(A) 3-deoxy-D-manno-octulosonic acid transferase [Pseudomonadota bacterium]|nr:lipid IV(A) 3-deoxy-D-manno-octulosonic acid transferase [Pseudomonadota bacterium]